MSIFTLTYGSPSRRPDSQQWVLPLLIAVAFGLLAIIIWLWFRCGDEPTVDWLVNGARDLPVRATP